MSDTSGNRKVTQTAHPSRRAYDLERLRRIQTEIGAKVVLEDCFKWPVNRVAGFDVAYLDDEAIAAAVTMDYDSLRVVEEKTIKGKVSFPYIPTFLGFREGPLLIRLAKDLKSMPDVLMINAQGIAHPLFCGCASHVGVSINKPTIGVTGSKLCGEYESSFEKVGDTAPLKYQGRTVGAALLSKGGCKPIFISVGHMISLETSIEIVKHFVTGHKFPEPLRLAHQLANKIRREASV